MDELLRILLKNSEASRASDLLKNYILQRKTLPDVAFLESVKSAVIALEETGNTTSDFSSIVLHKVCFPVILDQAEPNISNTRYQRTSEDRQKRHLAHDLLTICCGLHPETLLRTVCDACFCSISQFVDKSKAPTAARHETETLTLQEMKTEFDISAALDILGNLIRSKRGRQEGSVNAETGGVGSLLCEKDEERFFQALLCVLHSADEVLCAKIAGELLPHFLQSARQRVQPVWDLITDMTLEKGDCQLALNNLFTILCGLAEHFLTPPLPVAAEDITKAPAFWEILQCGLVQADPLVRKRAMYLLKKALDFTEESGDIVVVNSSEVRPVFYWDPARKADLLGVWQDYFLLMETLEERQVHLVKPVLPRVRKIFDATCKSQQVAVLMDISWVTTLIHRITLHENLYIRRWGLCELMTMDLRTCPLLDSSNWKFLFGPFLKMLNDNALYSRGDDNIRGDPPPVGSAVVSFFKACADNLAKTQQELFFKEFLTAVAHLGLHQVPLFFIAQALAGLPKLSTCGVGSLTSIQAIFPSLTTHARKIRGAVQCYLLKTAINLVDTDKVELSDIASFLSFFRTDESLCRSTALWEEMSAWFWRVYGDPAREMTSSPPLLPLVGVFHYLDGSINSYLDNSDPDVIHCQSVVQSLARMLVVACDAFRKNIRGSSAHESPVTKCFKTLVSIIRQASTHVYANESKTLRAVVLLTAILEVIRGTASLGSTSSYSRNSASLLVDNPSQPDPVVETFTPLVTSALPEILDYLLRKLTICGEIDSPEVGDLYVEFLREVYHFTVVIANSEIGVDCFMTFSGELAERCGGLIVKLNIAQKGAGKLSEEFWVRAFVAIKGLALLCTTAQHDAKFCLSSVTGVLVQHISQFSLKVDFSRPVTSPERAALNQGLEESVFSKGKWNRVNGEFIGALWTCVEFFLQRSESIDEGQANRINLNKMSILDSALESLALTSNESLLPAMRCIKLIVPHIVTSDQATCVRTLDVVWGSFMGRRGRDRDHDSFWDILRELVAILFAPSLLMLPEDNPLTEEVRRYGRKLLALAEDRVGVFNILVTHCCGVWSRDSKLGNRTVSSLTAHMELVLEACLFGPVPRRCERIINDVREYIRSLGDACPVNSLVSDDWRSEDCVRVNAINLLLTLDTTVPEHVAFANRFINALLAKDTELSDKKLRCSINSLPHRKKQRVWQTIIMLLPFVDNEFATDFLEALFKSLSCDNQASVRNIQRWIAMLVLAKYPGLHQLLWRQFQCDPTGKVSHMVSIMTIVVHLGSLISEPALRVQYYQQAFPAVVPWTTVQHFQVKMYAQAAVDLMWEACAKRRLTTVLEQHAILGPTVDFIRQGTKFKAQMTENFFLYKFSPLRDLSVETIFYSLPRLTKVCDSEWVTPDKFKQSPVGRHIWSTRPPIPLYNADGNPLVLLYQPGAHRRPEAEKHGEAGEEYSNDNNGNLGNVQKKITPWTILPPDDEIGIELRHQRTLAMQHSRAGKLVVVASLIDKAPNLGGLCRTCEIFGVEKLTLSSLHVTDNAQFKTLSVTSAKWVNIEEVRPADLSNYLLDIRREGYTLIGVEQTASSHNLAQYQFPHKSVLVLGHEKEGIPVEIIQCLDLCVEIPQMGVVRSLNVHVSGALLIWEYTRQLLQRASQQDT